MGIVVQSLADLVSDGVAVAETRRTDSDSSLLWPEEREALGRVSDGRRRDYTLSRWCTRQALERLGREPAPILSGPKREPLWPAGVVGSITHITGYVAAAVAPSDQLASIGIDAEPDEPLPAGVIRRVARPEELGYPDRLLFCAKEAVYKAWYPLARRWLGFADATLTFDSTEQTFQAQILVDGPLSTMYGRYGAAEGIILTTVEVRAAEQ